MKGKLMNKLNLNEKEVELILEALEALPKERMYQEFFKDLVKTIMSKDDETFSLDRKTRMQESVKKYELLENSYKTMDDDIIIIRAKFIEVKRFLLEKKMDSKIKEDIDNILNKEEKKDE